MLTSSVRISIDFSCLFSLINPDVENSSAGTSIDFSNLFSLKLKLTTGSVKLASDLVD